MLTIIPDATIKKYKNNLKITLSEGDLPKLKINNHYKKLLKDPNTSEEIKEFIKRKLKDAVWLIKTVGQRQENVLKVIRQIAKIQKKALVANLADIKPLSLKDIAQKNRSSFFNRNQDSFS